MTADTHALAGAYAVDALPRDERAFFERHLGACDTCRNEVDELRETAALLALVSVEPAPPALRERVLAAADVTRQLPPEPVAGPRGGGMGTRLRPFLAPVAAALALAVVVLGTITADLNRRVDELGDRVVAAQQDSQVLSVLAADDAQTVELKTTGDATVRLLYSPELDRAVLVTDGLPAPGEESVYELWLAHDGEPVPAGLFRPDDEGRSLTVVESNVSGAELAAITVEPRGGSAEPTGPSVAHTKL